MRAPRLWYTTVHITTTSTYIFYCWSLITLEWLLQIWNHCSVLFYYAKSVSYYNLGLQIKFLLVTTLMIPASICLFWQRINNLFSVNLKTYSLKLPCLQVKIKKSLKWSCISSTSTHHNKLFRCSTFFLLSLRIKIFSNKNNLGLGRLWQSMSA